MNKSVKLEEKQIKQIASVVSTFKLNPTFYKRKFLTFKLNDELRLRMLFFAVAICHQTHNLHSKKLNLWGWDYLEYGFLEMAKNNSPLLSPEYLQNTDKDLIIEQLLKYFSDDFKAETSTLDDIENRLALMIDSAEILNRKYNSKLSKLFDHPQAYLIKHGQGLYELLEKFRAYSDPQRKKSTFLIKLLKEAEIIKIIDVENFIPIMDYHMQRVLLRLGCVEITDETLKKDIIDKVHLKSDAPIRSACIEALKKISEQSKKEITKMNDFFWSLGRSCCNETTLCKDQKCSKQPCTFKTIVDIKDHGKCAFADVCFGSKDENYRKLWQPVVETHYY